jgi:hypothetical protein
MASCTSDTLSCRAANATSAPPLRWPARSPQEDKLRDDEPGQGLHGHDAEERTSPAVKIAGYLVIAILLLAIILLATGAVKFGPF